MSPATWPRERPLHEKLLVVDPRASRSAIGHVGDLPSYLSAGDLLVVNDAATLPASLHGRSERGEAVEMRLVTRRHDGAWDALLFGPGDWRTRTEDRAKPALFPVRSRILFAVDLAATVAAVSPRSPRLVTVTFDQTGAAFWSSLYRHGRPIQYAYLEKPLALWHVQTAYASRPWSSEMPSAGRPLNWEILSILRKRGIGVASLTHAAGISSTGEDALDALLPMREAYDIPQATVAAIARAKARGGRVVAVGTSVVRALEGNARDHGGTLVAGEGDTDLRLGPSHALAVVCGLFTGMHERTASHFALLQAFTPLPLLERAYDRAEAAGFLGHEFGDSALLLPGSLDRIARAG